MRQHSIEIPGEMTDQNPVIMCAAAMLNEQIMQRVPSKTVVARIRSGIWPNRQHLGGWSLNERATEVTRRLVQAQLEQESAESPEGRTAQRVAEGMVALYKPCSVL